jgi:hypothetical protein
MFASPIVFHVLPFLIYSGQRDSDYSKEATTRSLKEKSTPRDEYFFISRLVA